MFSWRNKKNINTFGLKKAPSLDLWSVISNLTAVHGFLHMIVAFHHLAVSQYKSIEWLFSQKILLPIKAACLNLLFFCLSLIPFFHRHL